jgi:pilus assembly protein Flp/PilA
VLRGASVSVLNWAALDSPKNPHVNVSGETMFTQLQNTLVLWLANLGSRERAATEGDDGQTLAEYAMILGLIAVVVVAVVTLLGTTISSLFSEVQQGI